MPDLPAPSDPPSPEPPPSADAAGLRRAGHPLPAALVDPHPDRLDVVGEAAAAAVDAHRRAVAEGADGYVDPTTGLFCFTARYHWEKGSCCELGCRHCPWLDADARLASAPPAGS